jgi:hypothetical protein
MFVVVLILFKLLAVQVKQIGLLPHVSFGIRIFATAFNQKL